MDIDFSIIIPTLNSEKYLPETIESLKNQDRSIKLEVIFSDGGSTDNTLKIINNFNQENIKKKIILDKIGLSFAINEGLKIASGKYLSYLNSDDVLNKNALFNTKKKFEQHEEINWLIGNCENIGKKKYFNKVVNIYKKILLNNLSFNILCVHNIISQPSVFWKKEFFLQLGQFNERLYYNMDYDMWLRMYIHSKPYLLKYNLSNFRRHSDSLSYKNTLKQFIEKFKTMRKYNKNFIVNILHILVSSIILLIYKVSNY